MTRLIGLVCLAAGALALAGCGDDDDDSKSESKATTLTLSGTLTGKKAKLSGVPTEPVQAGVVTLRFTNDAKQPQEVQLVRVDGNQTAQDVKKNILDTPEGAPTPPWAHGAGGVGITAPGRTAVATQVLEPGTYHAWSSGEETEEGFATFKVEGEGGGELPETDATVTADEYKFTSSGLKAGKNRITYDNAGKELHHVLAFPLAKGKTAADVKKFFETEKGPPPVDFAQASGTAVTDGGFKQVTDLELKQGKYAFVCFISDRKGGPPHAAKGMITEVDVAS